MFDQPKVPGSPVEDIFADADQAPQAAPRPTVPQPTPQPASAPVAPAVMPAPMLEAVEQVSSGGSRKWIMWVALGIVLLAAAGAAAWYLFFSSPAPATEGINPPSPSAPADSGEQVNAPSAPQPEQSSSIDADGDGLTAAEEAQYGTDPMRPDSDEDGLFDKEEVKIFQTNPLNPDTDGDGFSDGEEIQNGYNPSGSGRLLELPSAPPAN